MTASMSGNLHWIAAGMSLLLLFAAHRADYLDMKTSLIDSIGYGSNHGWHWPWTPIIQVCVVGLIFCLLGAKP